MGIVMHQVRVTRPRYERLVSGDDLWEPPQEYLSLDKVWAVLYRYLNFQEDFAFPRRMALAIAGGEAEELLQRRCIRRRWRNHLADINRSPMATDQAALERGGQLGLVRQSRARREVLAVHTEDQLAIDSDYGERISTLIAVWLARR
jgi:hypothetical protein